MNEDAFEFLEHHFRSFERVPPALGAVRAAGSWMRHIKPDYEGVLLRLVTPLTRSDVAEACKEEGLSIAEKVALICAWGGMKVGHGRSLFADIDTWQDAVEALGKGNITRREAYAVFSTLRGNGHLAGMGPAFFTKLIAFLAPQASGYIMDQWTARSVNLICGPTVTMAVTSSGHFVNDRNTPAQYEAFCVCVEELAKLLGGADPIDVEVALFCNGGRRPGPWRRYVKENG